MQRPRANKTERLATVGKRHTERGPNVGRSSGKSVVPSMKDDTIEDAAHLWAAPAVVPVQLWKSVIDEDGAYDAIP